MRDFFEVARESKVGLVVFKDLLIREIDGCAVLQFVNRFTSGAALLADAHGGQESRLSCHALLSLYSQSRPRRCFNSTQ